MYGKGNIRKKKVISVIVFLSILSVISFSNYLAGNEKIALEELRKQKIELIKNKKYKEAIKVIEKIIKYYPDSPDAKVEKFQLAYFYYLEKEYQKAIQIYKEIVKNPHIDWARKEALEWIVDIYLYNLKNPESAIRTCKKFIETYSNGKYVEDAYLLLAKSYIYAKQYDKAIETYQKYISEFPKSKNVKKALMEKARVYLYKKDYPKVIETYQELINKFPDTSESYLLEIANTYNFFLKDYEKAIKYYKKVIEISKNKSFVQTAEDELVKIYERTNKVDKAIELQKEIIEKRKLSDKELAIKIIHLAYLYFEKGKYQQGIKLLKEFIKKHPKTEEASMVYISLISHYKKREEYDKILKECENIVKNWPSTYWIVPYALLEKGLVYEKLKKYDKAIEIFKEIINKYPNTDFAKLSKIQVKIINKYLKRNKIPSPSEIKQMYKEEGILKIFPQSHPLKTPILPPPAPSR